MIILSNVHQSANVGDVEPPESIPMQRVRDVHIKLCSSSDVYRGAHGFGCEVQVLRRPPMLDIRDHCASSAVASSRTTYGPRRWICRRPLPSPF